MTPTSIWNQQCEWWSSSFNIYENAFKIFGCWLTGYDFLITSLCTLLFRPHGVLSLSFSAFFEQGNEGRASSFLISLGIWNSQPVPRSLLPNRPNPHHHILYIIEGQWSQKAPRSFLMSGLQVSVTFHVFLSALSLCPLEQEGARTPSMVASQLKGAKQKFCSPSPILYFQ